MTDLISRQAAIDAIRAMQTYKLFVGDDMLLVDQAGAQTELMLLPSAQPEITLEQAIDRLHELGWMQEHDCILTESAQPEIVRCKDCKHRTSYWGNCKLLEEKYHQSVLVDGDDFCSRAERREE